MSYRNDSPRVLARSFQRWYQQKYKKNPTRFAFWLAGLSKKYRRS